MNLKIKIVLLCLTGAMTAVASESGVSSSQPSSPLTPQGSIKKIASFLRLSPQGSWQQELAEIIAKDSRIRCLKLSDTDMNIEGEFLVDLCTWKVLNNVDSHKENNWKFSIQIKQVNNNDGYDITVQNPNIKYINCVYSRLIPGQTWNCNITQQQLLVRNVKGIIKMLNPCSPGYGE